MSSWTICFAVTTTAWDQTSVVHRPRLRSTLWCAVWVRFPKSIWFVSLRSFPFVSLPNDTLFATYSKCTIIPDLIHHCPALYKFDFSGFMILFNRLQKQSYMYFLVKRIFESLEFLNLFKSFRFFLWILNLWIYRIEFFISCLWNFESLNLWILGFLIFEFFEFFTLCIFKSFNF